MMLAKGSFSLSEKWSSSSNRKDRSCSSFVIGEAWGGQYARGDGESEGGRQALRQYQLCPGFPWQRRPTELFSLPGTYSSNGKAVGSTVGRLVILRQG